MILPSTAIRVYDANDEELNSFSGEPRTITHSCVASVLTHITVYMQVVTLLNKRLLLVVERCLYGLLVPAQNASATLHTNIVIEDF